jgi:rhodanese-related sulfurtransferase
MLFSSRSLYLVLLFLQIVIFSAYSYSDDTKISVLTANNLSIEGKVLLIDIRSEKEWQQTGVAPQAITLSMHQSGGILAFEKSLTALLNSEPYNNKDQPIALICAGGVRSAKLQRYLHQRGFTQVLDVVEGMQGRLFTDGWIDHGLPVKSYLPQ